MRELSLNILDIVHNSIRAGAKNISVSVDVDNVEDKLTVIIADDGCGMDKTLLDRVLDPFATTRTTRAVGMGLPLFREAAESADGGLSIVSEAGKGTKVTATFVLSHIDRMPLGSMADTLTAIIMAAPDAEIKYTYRFDEKKYVFNTGDIRTMLDGVPIESPEIIEYLKGYLQQEFETIDGGKII